LAAVGAHYKTHARRLSNAVRFGCFLTGTCLSAFGQADWQRHCLLRSLGIQASTGTESIESASRSIPPRQEFDLSRATKLFNLIQAHP